MKKKLLIYNFIQPTVLVEHLLDESVPVCERGLL